MRKIRYQAYIIGNHGGFNINNFYCKSLYMKVEGKVAIVTGGAQGLGEACVREFIQKNAKVRLLIGGCGVRFE